MKPMSIRRDLRMRLLRAFQRGMIESRKETSESIRKYIDLLDELPLTQAQKEQLLGATGVIIRAAVRLENSIRNNNRQREVVLGSRPY